jgi:hypothetical protein
MTLMPYPRCKWWPLLAAGLSLACFALAYAAPTSSTANGPHVYRWVDEHGVVHYGDRVPPQYAQQEASVLNGQGVEVGRLNAEKTPAEQQAAAREQDALQRQKQHDDFLLTTYTSVHDIEALRDERLELLKGQRLAAEQYIEGLHERLLALQARAMLFKPYNAEPRARRMPDDLAEQLVRTRNEIHTQRGALAARDQQEAAVRAQFQADIDRYRELHTATAAAAAH